MRRGPFVFIVLLAALLCESAGGRIFSPIGYTNRDNQPTRYGWDAARRLTAITNANTEIVRLAYDPAGNITNLVDGLLHTTSWQYNQYGWQMHRTLHANHCTHGANKK